MSDVRGLDAAPVDAPGDPHDAGALDAAAEGAADTGLDAEWDSGMDSGRDAMLSLDAGLDAEWDSGMDSGRDAMLSLDAGLDAGRDSGMASGRDAEGPPHPCAPEMSSPLCITFDDSPTWALQTTGSGASSRPVAGCRGMGLGFGAERSEDTRRDAGTATIGTYFEQSVVSPASLSFRMRIGLGGALDVARIGPSFATRIYAQVQQWSGPTRRVLALSNGAEFATLPLAVDTWHCVVLRVEGGTTPRGVLRVDGAEVSVSSPFGAGSAMALVGLLGTAEGGGVEIDEVALFAEGDVPTCRPCE